MDIGEQRRVIIVEPQPLPTPSQEPESAPETPDATPVTPDLVPAATGASAR
jgi:hypothetical protein